MHPHVTAEIQARQKSSTTALILSICLGYLGADRLYLGHVGLGLLKMVTCGGAGIWWLIDLFLIGSATEQENLRIGREVLARYGL